MVLALEMLLEDSHFIRRVPFVDSHFNCLPWDV